MVEDKLSDEIISGQVSNDRPSSWTPRTARYLRWLNERTEAGIRLQRVRIRVAEVDGQCRAVPWNTFEETTRFDPGLARPAGFRAASRSPAPPRLPALVPAGRTPAGPCLWARWPRFTSPG